MQPYEAKQASGEQTKMLDLCWKVRDCAHSFVLSSCANILKKKKNDPTDYVLQEVNTCCVLCMV